VLKPFAFALGLSLAASHALAQEAFRCTSPDGKVTYQQTPCPKTSEERKVDTTPANPEFDPRAREQLLKEGAEAGRRLQAREAEDEAARRRRSEQQARDEQRERETKDREDARDVPVHIYARPPGPNYPYPPSRPQPLPATAQPNR